MQRSRMPSSSHLSAIDVTRRGQPMRLSSQASSSPTRADWRRKRCRVGRISRSVLPDSAELIQWNIGDEGFVMHLSGEVPARIAQALETPEMRRAILGNRTADEIPDWAVHAGGRSILDAVEHGLGLGAAALAASRETLRRFGNMSSATLMFALAALMARADIIDGIAVAFGPGLAAEGFAISSI